MAGSLIVRRSLPAGLRRLLAIAAAILLVVSAWGFYTLGGYHAGLDRTATNQQRRAQNSELAELRRLSLSLRERITQLETSRDIDRQAYRQVELSLADLQAEVQAKEEELQFYRGIVLPEDRVPGLRLGRTEIRPASDGGGFTLRMVIVQALRQPTRLEGRVRLTLTGHDDDGAASLNLAEWLASETGSVDFAFSFRYFQELEWEFRLPDGFVAEKVQVELTPSGRQEVPLNAAIDWPGETAS